MRTRSAKQRAQRIDLNYFKRPGRMRRWRMILSIAVPLVGLVWLGGMAAAGNRAPYSSGPVSSAHAFIEMKCETCHQQDTAFRAHVTDAACLTCHSAPDHPPSRPSAASAGLGPPMPLAAASAGQAPHPIEQQDCASCHREHQGRVALAAAVPDRLCVDCHGDLTPAVARFPSGHPEFAAVREALRDPGTIRFNHQVHANENLRGPNGPEKLECATCHRPQLAATRTAAAPRVDNLMTSVTYDQQCARCHGLFFDERIDAPAPHTDFKTVRAFVRTSLADYIAANPQAISEREGPPRRVPLNFPREAEPVARNAQEWLMRRTGRAERHLERTCAYCHAPTDRVDDGEGSIPQIRPANLRTEWMPRSTFDHAPHLVVECSSCHRAEESRETADVLMPSVTTCATCHAPAKGAPTQCADCHGYHDWTKASPVKPHFRLSDFQ